MESGLPLLHRLSKLVSLASKEYLRIAGSAFLVDGVMHCIGPDRSLSMVQEGPCMLPAAPALYWCTTDVKVGWPPSPPPYTAACLSGSRLLLLQTSPCQGHGDKMLQFGILHQARSNLTCK